MLATKIPTLATYILLHKFEQCCQHLCRLHIYLCTDEKGIRSIFMSATFQKKNVRWSIQKIEKKYASFQRQVHMKWVQKSCEIMSSRKLSSHPTIPDWLTICLFFTGKCSNDTGKGRWSVLNNMFNGPLGKHGDLAGRTR